MNDNGLRQEDLARIGRIAAKVIIVMWLTASVLGMFVPRYAATGDALRIVGLARCGALVAAPAHEFCVRIEGQTTAALEFLLADKRLTALYFGG